MLEVSDLTKIRAPIGMLGVLDVGCSSGDERPYRHTQLFLEDSQYNYSG